MQNFASTLRACSLAALVQSIIINFAPLLFMTFHTGFGIPLEQIAALTGLSFFLQLIIDALSVKFLDRLGYRRAAVLAHTLAAVGLCLLALLPDLLPDPFLGILIPVLIYSGGAGLLEVLISPIVEACPSKNKEKTMTAMHSFYCWGQVLTVLLSTVFFTVFGIQNWKILAFLWAVFPVVNAAIFLRVPICMPHPAQPLTPAQFFKNRLFWILAALMICGGAAEQSIAQWASAFAEAALHVPKTTGDLLGPMLFAVGMGISRSFFARSSRPISLSRFMLISGVLCLISYFIMALCPLPVLALAGCGLCGLSVGILWPGTLSLSAAAVPGGGTALFALLALGGDIGCSAGPSFVGLVSGAFGDALSPGILAASVFPAALIVLILLLRRHTKTPLPAPSRSS